jgi:hypothetical protein
MRMHKSQLDRRSSIAVLLSAVAIGCSNESASENPEIALKRVVAQNLKDPDSAQFRSLYLHKTKKRHILCGEVNGKNAFGGYGGFKPFVVVGGPPGATAVERIEFENASCRQLVDIYTSTDTIVEN